MNKGTLSTKYGVFEVVKNDYNENHTDLYFNSKKVFILTTQWWNTDALLELVEQNIDKIKAKIELIC